MNIDPRNYTSETLIYEPKIQVVAYSQMVPLVIPGASLGQNDGTDGERLIEFAGRICYDSYGRGRSSVNFHKHIQEVGHGSVTEHASASFVISGVSRGCTHEFIRHRVGVGISQRSTRFVNESTSKLVVPPLFIIREGDSEDVARAKRTVQNTMDAAHAAACRDYLSAITMAEIAMEGLRLEATAKRKAARGAARSYLGQNLETELVWTANVRTIINVIAQRAADGAEAEICRVAMRLYEEASVLWPAYFEGMAQFIVPRSDGTGNCFSQVKRL